MTFFKFSSPDRKSPLLRMSGSIEHLYSSIILILILVVLAIFLGDFVKHKKFKYFSETAGTVILGLFAGLILDLVLRPLMDIDSKIKISAEFFYLVLLPPIIFEVNTLVKVLISIHRLGMRLEEKTFSKTLGLSCH